MQAQTPDWLRPVNKNFGTGPVNTNLEAGLVNTNLGPGRLNTNWGPGPVNTKWEPGPVNTNCEPGPGERAGARGQTEGRSREIQIPFYFICKHKLIQIITIFLWSFGSLIETLFSIVLIGILLSHSSYFNLVFLPIFPYTTTRGLIEIVLYRILK